MIHFDGLFRSDAASSIMMIDISLVIERQLCELDVHVGFGRYGVHKGCSPREICSVHRHFDRLRKPFSESESALK